DESQTEGPDLPDVVSKLEGLAPDGVFEKLTVFAESIGFRVERPESLDSGANGDTSHSEGRIRVVASNSEAQQTKTLAHEIGHALLHDPESATTKDLTRGLKELEAESIAYVICTALGMDTSDYSFGYVAGWAGGGPEAIAGVKESAGRIQKASTAVLKTFEVEEPAVEVSNELGVVMEPPRPVPVDPQRGSRQRGRDLDSRLSNDDPSLEASTEPEFADALVDGPRASEASTVELSFDDEQVNPYRPLSSVELEVLDASALGDREVEFGR
ncbi:MAG: ImmA/IrrE family metallo-endopeptidase, partial [Acidimicrobiales bacterium]